jgi:uncharacterized protein (TIGR00251 family)
MLVKVRVIPNTKDYSIEEEDGVIIVRLKEKPEKNKANQSLVRLLTKYYNKKVKIVSGFKSNDKIVQVG